MQLSKYTTFALYPYASQVHLVIVIQVPLYLPNLI